MILPENFESKIGFDFIREKIKSYCMGVAARELVDNISFSTNIDFINRALSETEEMLGIYRLKNDYPAKHYPEVATACAKLNTKAACLSLDDLVNIRSVLEISKSLVQFYIKFGNSDYPFLYKRVKNIHYPSYLQERLNATLSKHGQIKDSASIQLRDIRKRLGDAQGNLTKNINSILSTFRTNGWIGRDLSPTLVNGRLVLPIESTFKRKVDGFIHDESASGKTAYIEPREVMNLNNSIRELELEENREIQKILIELTEDFRPYKDEFKSLSKLIAELDLIRAKAIFSDSIEAIKPSVEDKPKLEIIRARHPLLHLSLKRDNKEVVPLNFNLNNESRILLISGPNAGGKSVSLKTTALISYMLQCGMLVPVGGTSVIGIFENIFLDIGDQQSIDNDLSTYSSHLTNMKMFLKNSNEKTLVLIDEFGSGTDPIIGGVIAEAILEDLNNKHVCGVITTHYSNLKIMASNSNGIQNAAMLIDQNKMMPTFILETGIPGSSYAIEIAQRIGLPHSIIENVKNKSGADNINIDKFLRRVLRDKKYWEQKRKEIRIKEKQLEETIDKNVIALEDLKNKKKQIIDNARKESEQLLADVNKNIENTIRKIKESDADKEVTKNAREEIQNFTANLKNEQNELDKKDNINEKLQFYKKKQDKKQKDDKKLEFVNIDKTKINIGSKVRLKGHDTIGDVIDISEKNAVVSYGSIYTTVPFDKLEKVDNHNTKEPKSNSSKHLFNYNEKVLNFNSHIDVRGDRLNDAIQKITELVDEAIMLSFKELKILHGKGNGILRSNIRAYLRTIPHVEACYDEDIRFGGSGITIVKLK